MELKWLLRPSWRMLGAWVFLMSGILALAKDAYFTFLAAHGQPVPAGPAWAIFGYIANAGWVLAGGAVVFTALRNQQQAETALAGAQAELTAMRNSPPLIATGGTDPTRAYVRDTPRQIQERLRAARWNEQDAIAQASYIGRWFRGRGEIYQIEKQYDGSYSAVIVPSVTADVEESVHVRFKAADGPRLEVIDDGDVVEYEGQIESVKYAVVLENVTFTAQLST